MDTKVKLNSEVMLIVKAPYNKDFIEELKGLGVCGIPQRRYGYLTLIMRKMSGLNRRGF